MRSDNQTLLAFHVHLFMGTMIDDGLNDNDGRAVIYTPREVLVIGSTFRGWTIKHLNKAKHESNLQHFRKHYVCSPLVVAQIWEDLQFFGILDVAKSKLVIKNLFEPLHFMKIYPTETEQEVTFGKSAKTLCEKAWKCLEAVQALKEYKIVWMKVIFVMMIFRLLVLMVFTPHSMSQEHTQSFGRTRVITPTSWIMLVYAMSLQYAFGNQSWCGWMALFVLGKMTN